MEDGIRQATLALADALRRGDAAAAAALYADDGKLLSATADLIAGRREIEAYWRAGIGIGLSRLELQPLGLERGSWDAVEFGRYVLALERDGDTRVADRGKYLVLHRRQADGSWRRAVDVFNPDVLHAARRYRKEER
jgi:ketosteroid isomerase-like protein